MATRMESRARLPSHGGATMGECALRMVNDEEAPGGEEAGNVQPADRAASGHDGACVAHRDPADSLRALHVVAAVVSQSPALAKALNAVLDRLLDLAPADIGAGPLGAGG